ncbi:LCP family protein [Gudongella sp. DL1XJH-153]|uniref:LCP family protein n=1 Tax=Gudongella sp. DL1XJH-153 TaxID=3409804 RepID=UPI003BB63630
MKKQFIAVFMASLLIFGAFYGILANTVFKDDTAVASDPEQIEDPSQDKEPVEEEKNDILFLLMGVDAQDIDESEGTRTDTMMLTSIDLDTGKISILSIPRDTRTTVQGRLDKINAAHAYAGPEYSVEVVQNLLDIDLEYYVKVDYQIVQDVVNSIGGVTVEVPFNMKYRDPTAKPPLNINIQKGIQTLDGKNAHDFLRFRHNNDFTVGYPDGDVGRTKTQQYFMKELVKQTMKPKNLLKLPMLIETYFDNVETNIPISVMLKGALAANKIDVESMETATLPGEGSYIGGISYYIHNGTETEEVIRTMFGNYLVD